MAAAPGGVPTATEVKADLRTHEAICAERYIAMMATLAEIKKSLFWMFSLIMGSLVSVIGGLLLKLLIRS